MKSSESIRIGYDFDLWYDCQIKSPITMNIAKNINKNTIIAGLSGSGKSYAVNAIFAKLANEMPENAEFFFLDYKMDDNFKYLRKCTRYYSYKETLKGFEVVYQKLQKRLSGEDEERHPIVLIWDEYVANIISLYNEDKKNASVVMAKMSETLMICRSMSIMICLSVQRPDSICFPLGSRLNFATILVLGSPSANRSIYEMLIPDHMDKIEDRSFRRGEGVLLLQGVETSLHFIKIGMIKDICKMQELCIKALS